MHAKFEDWINISFFVDCLFCFSTKIYFRGSCYLLLFTVIVRMLDVQIESATALILCAISCIILIIPINPTSTKMLIVVILTPVAGNVLQLTLKTFFHCNFCIHAGKFHCIWSICNVIIVLQMIVLFHFILYFVFIKLKKRREKNL